MLNLYLMQLHTHIICDAQVYDSVVADVMKKIAEREDGWSLDEKKKLLYQWYIAVQSDYIRKQTTEKDFR